MEQNWKFYNSGLLVQGNGGIALDKGSGLVAGRGNIIGSKIYVNGKITIGVQGENGQNPYGVNLEDEGELIFRPISEGSEDVLEDILEKLKNAFLLIQKDISNSPVYYYYKTKLRTGHKNIKNYYLLTPVYGTTDDDSTNSLQDILDKEQTFTFFISSSTSADDFIHPVLTIGSNNKVSNKNILFGENSSIVGDYNFGFMEGGAIRGDYNLAVTKDGGATGNYSLAFGQCAVAGGDHSTVIGENSAGGIRGLEIVKVTPEKDSNDHAKVNFTTKTPIPEGVDVDTLKNERYILYISQKSKGYCLKDIELDNAGYNCYTAYIYTDPEEPDKMSFSNTGLTSGTTLTNTNGHIILYRYDNPHLWSLTLQDSDRLMLVDGLIQGDNTHILGSNNINNGADSILIGNNLHNLHNTRYICIGNKIESGICATRLCEGKTNEVNPIIEIVNEIDDEYQGKTVKQSIVMRGKKTYHASPVEQHFGDMTYDSEIGAEVQYIPQDGFGLYFDAPIILKKELNYGTALPSDNYMTEGRIFFLV